MRESKRAEGEWVGETGRRPCREQLVEKRGKREYQGGLKSDWARQYNWGQTRNDRECQLRQKKVLQPVDQLTQEPSVDKPNPFGPDTQNTPPRPLWQRRTFPQERPSAGDGGPIISQLQYTPYFVQTQQQHTYPSSSIHTDAHVSQFPGIKVS